LWSVGVEGGEPQRLGLTVGDIRFQGARLHPDGLRVVFGNIKANLEVWVLENFLPPAKAAK
jgi:hypothetical protein